MQTNGWEGGCTICCRIDCSPRRRPSGRGRSVPAPLSKRLVLTVALRPPQVLLLLLLLLLLCLPLLLLHLLLLLLVLESLLGGVTITSRVSPYFRLQLLRKREQQAIRATVSERGRDWAGVRD